MAATMQAVQVDRIGGPEVLQLVELPRPEPGPTDVLVRIEAAGVNPVDWKTRAGQGVADLLGPPPWILGWDLAGVVEATGAGVTRFNPGDRVFGMPSFPQQAGAYAEYAVAPSRQLAPIPPSLGTLEAAALPLAGLTAWQALVDTAAIQPGQRVLIHAAAGGVGHLAAQIALAHDAYVVATASAAKHDRLRQLGVQELIDYRVTPFQDAIGDIDVVVDLVGGATAHDSVEVLRPGGLLVLIPSGNDLPDPKTLDEAGVRATWMLVEPDHHGLKQLTRLINDGCLDVWLDHVGDLHNVAEIHRTAEQGHSLGKNVLDLRRN